VEEQFKKSFFLLDMSKIYLFLILVLFLSCGQSKEVVHNEVDESPLDQNSFIGKVELNKTGCPILIRLEDSGAQLYPVNLDEIFKVDGAYLEFRFGPSRAMQPEECSDVKVVSVSDVVRLKR
jgi:hypothetical protein